MSTPRARRRRPPGWRPSSSTPRSARWSIDDALVAAAGFGCGAQVAELVQVHGAAASGSRCPGWARCHWPPPAGTASGPGACSSRASTTPLDAEESSLLLGMARVLGLALRGVAALETERTLGAERERRARERLATAGLPARAPSPARGPAGHPALDLAPQAAVRRAGGGDRGRQRPARGLPGRARARGSAGPRSPDRRVDHRRWRMVGVRARHGRHRGGGGGQRLGHGPRPGGGRPHQRRPRRRARGDGTAGRRFDDAQLGMLDAFAENASLALTDAKTVGAMASRRCTTRSPGLPNRALFVDRLQHALEWRPGAERRGCCSSTWTASRRSTTARPRRRRRAAGAPWPSACRGAACAARHRGAPGRRRVRCAAGGRSGVACTPIAVAERIIAALRAPSARRARRSSAAPRSASPSRGPRRRRRAAAQRRRRDVPRQGGRRRLRGDLRAVDARRGDRAPRARGRPAQGPGARRAGGPLPALVELQTAGPSASRRSSAGATRARASIAAADLHPGGRGERADRRRSGAGSCAAPAAQAAAWRPRLPPGSPRHRQPVGLQLRDRAPRPSTVAAALRRQRAAAERRWSLEITETVLMHDTEAHDRAPAARSRSSACAWPSTTSAPATGR